MPSASTIAAQATPAAQEVLAGVVERVTYHNEDNCFSVLRVKARSHRELITVVGHAAVISAGEWITASGDWTNDRTHGQQFKARFLKMSAPTSEEGIEKYLGSGMILGIGPVFAKKMLRAFGSKVFDIIEAKPHRLHEVSGIGPVRAGRIIAAWAEQKVVREIMVFLHGHGVGTVRAVRIFKTYGADAVCLNFSWWPNAVTMKGVDESVQISWVSRGCVGTYLNRGPDVRREVHDVIGQFVTPHGTRGVSIE